MFYIALLILAALALMAACPRSILARATAVVIENEKMQLRERTWPGRIARWAVFVVGLVSIVLLAANLTSVSAWFVDPLR